MPNWRKFERGITEIEKGWLAQQREHSLVSRVALLVAKTRRSSDCEKRYGAFKAPRQRNTEAVKTM